MKKRLIQIVVPLAMMFVCVSSLSAEPERPASRAIARIWRGRTLASKADEYQGYLDASGIPRVRATPGNLGVTVLRRNDGGKTEFLVMSVWESVDAIKKFAGEDTRRRSSCRATASTCSKSSPVSSTMRSCARSAGSRIQGGQIWAHGRLWCRRGGPCGRPPPVVVSGSLSREGASPPLRREWHDGACHYRLPA